MEKQIQRDRKVCSFKLSLASNRKTFPARHILSSDNLFLNQTEQQNAYTTMGCLVSTFFELNV